jgi:hypothetical protein
MAGSARAFAMGRIGIVQALFSKSGEDGLSTLLLTRKDLYARGQGSERCPFSPAPTSTGAVSVRRPHMSKEQGRSLTFHSLQEVEEGRRSQDQGPTNLCHG